MDDRDKAPPAPPTREGIDRAIRAAGGWSDMDTDALIDQVYRARHESPTRPLRG